MPKNKRKNWSKNCQEIIKLGTYLILFTPLIISARFFFPFVGPKSLYFMALVEIIFFTWIFLITFDSRFRPRFNKILGSLILFLIILIISATLGVDPSYSFWSKFERMTGILMMLHLLAFFLVISSTFEEKDWRQIFAVSIFVGVIVGVIALMSKNPAMRGGGTIGNDSFLGTYLLFNLFLALYLIFKNAFKTCASICFSLMFLCLFLSGARAAKLSFLGGMILISVLYLVFMRKERYLKILGSLFVIFSFIAVIAIGILFFQSDYFHQQIFKITPGRVTVWDIAKNAFLEKPWLGWGPENFEFAFTKNFNPCMGTSKCGADVWYDRVHNIIFDTLVASGIFGMLAYLGIFVLTFYTLWKNYFRKKFDFWTPGIFTVLLISYSVQNLTVFDMVSSYMMFFLILGFIARKERVLDFEIKTVNFIYLILIFVIFSLSFLEFVILPFKTDTYTISAIRAEPFSEERLSLYEKTLSFSPVGRYQIREFFVESTLSAKISEEIPQENVKREFDFLTQELEKSVKECSLNFRAYLKLGQLYNIYSRYDPSKIQEAERALKKAIEVSPVNQQGYWNLAQTKIYQGKFEEALSLTEKAVGLEPHLERSHLIAIEIARIMGDFELMEKKIKEAIEINPEWEKDLRSI